MRVGDRCVIWKTGRHWVVQHWPSEVVVWAGFEFQGALGFATGAGRKK